MQFGHEQLDVYRVSLEYVAWAYRLAKRLQGADRHARDQLLRASQSIPQNIAEGNGKGTKADRRRFFEIARGSALEYAAIQDTPGFAKGQRIQSTRHSRMHLAGIQTSVSLGPRQIHAGTTGGCGSEILPISGVLVLSEAVLVIVGL